ncbi:MAG: TetR/AcrR family transcriptional regulator [Alphaproteobacteria bacterium]|nr:MAG: TetR/AcrR family transcriptional regulator [Alphaproteobacteria bacterium]
MNATQTLLLDLGEAAMMQRGFDGFSYADIARDAGIRKASIHYHFPTKQDLGLAVLNRYSHNLLDRLAEIRQSTRTGGQALATLIEMYRRGACNGGLLCLCAALSGDAHAIDENMRSALKRINDLVVQSLEDILIIGRKDRSISVGGEPKAEATSILATLQGAQLLARAADDVGAFDEATAMLRTRIFRA